MPENASTFNSKRRLLAIRIVCIVLIATLLAAFFHALTNSSAYLSLISQEDILKTVAGITYPSLLVITTGLILYYTVHIWNAGVSRTKATERMGNIGIWSIIFTFIVHMVAIGIGFFSTFELMLLILMATLGILTNNELSTPKQFENPFRTEKFRSALSGTGTTHTGYIKLDFFHLFWVFALCAMLGLAIEDIYHVFMFHNWESRAGLLWGPFSPIYGFGALFMTIALNQFWKKNPFFIFVISALVGGTFEIITSLFLQYAFGVTAWDYTGTFGSIDGRTNFRFMCYWGVLGLIWIKVLLPRLLVLINAIPLKYRVTLTSLMAVFMVINVAMTLTTIDCWYLRTAQEPVETSVQKMCATRYDDQYMERRFATMDMNVDESVRH